MRCAEHARMAAAALNVDEELQPHKVLRVIDVDGAALRMCGADAHGDTTCPYFPSLRGSAASPRGPPPARRRIATIYPRLLRLSVKGILDFAAVTVESLQEFGGEPSS